jgi:hypothetical protein
MLASIIYNYGKFCDDFKSTLKLGAYVSTASPWNQRNSFWISVSSATEYPSFLQMDSICLFGIPVFGFLSSKYRIFDNNWVIEQNFEQPA